MTTPEKSLASGTESGTGHGTGTGAEAIVAVTAFCGQAPSDRWRAQRHEDAWLVTQTYTGRGGSLFLVRDGVVQPFQLARTTIEDAYQRLLARTADGACTPAPGR